VLVGKILPLLVVLLLMMMLQLHMLVMASARLMLHVLVDIEM
jgi:hypothetical protein